MNLVVFKIRDGLIELRVDANQEEQGLDIALHDKQGYISQAAYFDSRKKAREAIPCLSCFNIELPKQ